MKTQNRDVWLLQNARHILRLKIYYLYDSKMIQGMLYLSRMDFRGSPMEPYYGS